MNGTLRKIIEADLYRYGSGIDRRVLWRTFLREPGFRYSYFLRKCHYYRFRRGVMNQLRYWSNKWFLRRYSYRYGYNIHDVTQIGAGLYLPHFGGISIHPQAVIGSNVNIGPGVNIGQTNRGRKGVPTIGNCVYLGPHAILVGDIRIGDRALIGPGAVVSSDVPAKAVVSGNPGKIVSYFGVKGYIENTVTVDQAVADELAGKVLQTNRSPSAAEPEREPTA